MRSNSHGTKPITIHVCILYIFLCVCVNCILYMLCSLFFSYQSIVLSFSWLLSLSSNFSQASFWTPVYHQLQDQESLGVSSFRALRCKATWPSARTRSRCGCQGCCSLRQRGHISAKAHYHLGWWMIWMTVPLYDYLNLLCVTISSACSWVDICYIHTLLTTITKIGQRCKFNEM